MYSETNIKILSNARQCAVKFNICSYFDNMEKKPSKNNVILSSKKVFNIDKLVCNLIRDEYIDDSTNRLVGDTMGKSEHIVRKVKDEYGYNIPLSTLNAFCVSQKIKLSDFFKMLEEKNGSVIEDSFKIIQVEKKKKK